MGRAKQNEVNKVWRLSLGPSSEWQKYANQSVGSLVGPSPERQKSANKVWLLLLGPSPDSEVLAHETFCYVSIIGVYCYQPNNWQPWNSMVPMALAHQVSVPSAGPVLVRVAHKSYLCQPDAALL